MKFNKKYAGLLIIILIYLVLVLLLYIKNIKANNGVFVYILDDTYIHLSVAKNLVLNGVYGINSNIFSSSSSSPIWTLLLALTMKIFGIKLIIPLILNVIIWIANISLLFNILTKKFKNKASLIFTLLIALITPMIYLTFSGMEHSLETFAALLFIYLIYGYLVENKEKSFYFALFLSLIMPLIRYELYFMILSFSLVLLFEKKFFKAALPLICGIIPVVIFGLVSVSNNGLFFPNSILLKGSISTDFGITFLFHRYFYLIIKTLSECTEVYLLMVLLIALSFYFIVKDRGFSRRIKYSIFVSLSMMLHFEFSMINNGYRYEAYIICYGLTGLLLISDINISELVIRFKKQTMLGKIIIFIACSVIFMPFLHRAFKSTERSDRASKNIYEQQFQMSRIINRLGNENIFAVNDIGLVTFYNDNKFVDIYGLSNDRIAKAKIHNNYNADFINQVLDSNKVNYAFIFDDWFKGSLEFQKKWIYSGKLLINDNVICGSDKVSLYSKDSTSHRKLVNVLNEMKNTILSIFIISDY